ncbi:MAG: Endonuclease III [candidate division TA06 bacterium ADurb.Bin131]|uniref:Endonuclease III n=1 Tax=candidate division TA06 bacterium ADurb.Bin131 TaxID=1852827 RepID=A0A1V6C6E4_UNCT6|nr:MAG: Endonuclease III [candidate division TA06 bacterium ADurb.Bin131]
MLLLLQMAHLLISMAEDFLDKKIKNKITSLYQQLLSKYGVPYASGQWQLWCKRPKSEKEKEVIIIESILTQRANWKNVQIAVKHLEEKNLLSLQSIVEAEYQIIENLIRPSGFYRQKTKRLKDLANFFVYEIGGIKGTKQIKTPLLREKLLSIDGVGKETADDILLYALERPVFVIDEYTKRFVKMHNLSSKFSYDFLQRIFENSIKKDYKIYEDYHALIVIEMKEKQKKS